MIQLRAPIRKALTLVACLYVAAAVNAQNPARIEGVVRDVNSAAIAGAAISCAATPNSIEGRTDTNGHFGIEADTCKTPILLITARGFASVSVPIPSTLNGDLEIVMQPSAISVIVTVSGLETSIGDSPESVVVKGREDLANPGGAAIDDGLRQVPGFTLFRRTSSRTANPTSQGVSLRGVGGSGASRAVVLSDGIPLNDPFGGWVYWGRVAFESVDQVEILRGPGSDQYGSSAIGGVISIRSRRPSPGLFTSIGASYATMSTPAFSSFSSLGSQRLSGSLAAEFFRTGGYVPIAGEWRGRVDTQANVSRIGLRPRVDVAFSSGRAFVAGEFYEERRQNGTTLQSNDTRIRGGSVGLDLDPSSLGSVALRMFGLEEEYHQSFSTIAQDRNSEILSRLQRVPLQAFGTNIRWSKEFGKHVIFGNVEFRGIRGVSQETGFNGAPTSRTEAGGKQRTFAAAAGGRSTFGRFLLNGTLRYDRTLNHSGRSIVRSASGTTLSATQFPSRSDSSINGRVSLLARLSDRVNLSGAYASGFREPTLNELYRGFRLGNVVTLPNEGLRAERANSVETAVAFTDPSGRVYVRAGGYCISIRGAVSNVTLSVTPSLITRRRGNLDSSRSCGFEADGKFRLTHSLWLSTDYLFVNSIVSASGGSPSTVGLRLPQVARHQFSLQANWTSRKWGSVLLQARGTSSQFDDDQNVFGLRGYAVVGGMYSRSLDPNVDIYAAIENAFNTRIEAGRTPVLTLGQPRTARIGLRIRLGRGR